MIYSVKGYKIGMEVSDKEGYTCRIISFPNRTSVSLKCIDGTYSQGKQAVSDISPTKNSKGFTSKFRLTTNIGEEFYNYLALFTYSNKMLINFFSDMINRFNKDLRGNDFREFMYVSRMINNKYIRI